MKDLFLLDPGVVYLNHGSFGACPRPVFERYQAWQRVLEREPVEFLARERGFGDLFEQARLRLAAYLGADPANVVFTPNATTGLNAAVRSLDLRPGDVVLMGDREYGGLLRLWEFVARRTGARIERVPFEELDPGPGTRVVFCSHVEWTSGRVNDVAELCRRARKAGAVSIVDGAHAPGQIELDLEAIGADVYGGNCHKWMCAPKGSGFLYARPELHGLIDPTVVSWDWEDGAPFADVHRWQGTRDPSGFLAVPEAIDFQDAHDWPAVRARCHRLLERARERLPLEPLTDRFVQMLGFRIDHPDAGELTRRLYADHRVEVPVFESAGGWVLRVSAQAYNDDEDIDVLAEALASVGVR
ncbi:MAG TPA: aminotransferase class V-fold PLP-dependent enzyme [Gaiellaceae bacterium]|nr:aminotransferase class V-fold PLP-dependent enzyme [Gaiellaceae bacterium]